MKPFPHFVKAREQWVSHGLGCLLLLLCLAGALPLRAQESWGEAFSRMPLGGHVTQLTRTNCVDVMLHALKSNNVVKALVFMPGATDELNMYRRAQAVLTNSSPTLLDAVMALTNQTLIRATFRPPLLLLHSDEDPLEPLVSIDYPTTVAKLKAAQFQPFALFHDQDWDALQPALKKSLKVDIQPWRYSTDSWHFYRHSFAAFGLNGWEALEAASLAGKTAFTVRHNLVVFRPDVRVRTKPHLDAFPH
jgi:hypothetical protein